LIVESDEREIMRNFQTQFTDRREESQNALSAEGDDAGWSIVRGQKQARRFQTLLA
jgi:hypothetical protein